MSTGKVMCVRQAHIDAQRKRKVLAGVREEMTHQITERWKTGYAELKAENDKDQKDRDDFVKTEKAKIDEELANAVDQCAEEFQR